MFLQRIYAALKHSLVNSSFRKSTVEICCRINAPAVDGSDEVVAFMSFKKRVYIYMWSEFLLLITSYIDLTISPQPLWPSLLSKLWDLIDCVVGSHPRKLFTHSKRIQWEMGTYKLLYVSVWSCTWCIRNHCGRVKLMKHRQDNTYWWSQAWHINALDMMLIPDLARVFRSCRLPAVIRKTLWWMLHPVILSICCLCLFPLSAHH